MTLSALVSNDAVYNTTVAELEQRIADYKTPDNDSGTRKVTRAVIKSAVLADEPEDEESDSDDELEPEPAPEYQPPARGTPPQPITDNGRRQPTQPEPEIGWSEVWQRRREVNA